MTTATLALKFSREVDRTSVRVVQQDSPWRALRCFPNASGEALVHLHNVSGGILGGDHLHMDVTLKPKAQAQITTVGATRIHQHRLGRVDAAHTSCCHICEGAMLEFLPDSVIPFANSRFSQNSKIHLADDAGLIWWEIFSAGRLAHNEAFGFERFSTQTSISSTTGPVFIENYSLEPKLRDMTSPTRMGKFLYSASMYVCRADCSSRWLQLENDLNEIARELSGPGTCWGASCLVRHGLLVRGLSQNIHQVTTALNRLWQVAKQSVWGRIALPPRKVY